MKKIFSFLTLTFCMFGIFMETAIAERFCRPCPLDCYRIDTDERDCRNVTDFDNQGRCCVELSRHGENKLYAWENRQNEFDPRRNDPQAYDDKRGFNPGDCPPGFHVNDRKCTDNERKKGCKDLRSDSGKTCVGWKDGRR